MKNMYDITAKVTENITDKVCDMYNRAVFIIQSPPAEARTPPARGVRVELMSLGLVPVMR